MPRRPRFIRPGATYHLISRFVDRNWYIKREQERSDYLALLGRALRSSDWRCLAYAVMSNHIHLVAIAGNHPLDSWVRRVHSPFADAMNRAYDRIGPMFVRGPKALPVRTDAIGHVIAYVHNNPVRAKVVDEASASSWTSHRAYVGLARAPVWLDVEQGLAVSGFNSRAAFEHWVGDPERATFDELHDRDIADESPVENVGDSSINPHAIVSMIAGELGLPLEQLRSRRRGRMEATGREAVVLCAQRFGMTGAEIARALSISQQSVSAINCRGARMGAVAVASRVIHRLMSEVRL